MQKVTSCLIGYIALASMMDATAQNAVQNGDFDTDIAAWNQDVGAQVEFQTAQNAVGAPGSGAMHLTNPIGDGTYQTFQCVSGPFPAGVYDFGAWLLLPQGQAGAGFARVGASAFSDAACSTAIAGTLTFVQFGVENGEWTLQTASKTLPSDAGSVRILLQAASAPNNGNALSTYFDGVRFGPAPTLPVELQTFEVE